MYSDYDDLILYRLFLFGWDDYFNLWFVWGICYIDVNKKSKINIESFCGYEFVNYWLNYILYIYVYRMSNEFGYV